MKTAIITSSTSLNHLTGNGHPENPDRVTVVIEKLKQNKNLVWKNSIKFDEKYLNITHSENYVLDVKKSFPNNGLKFLDGDTIVSPGSKSATIDAVGSIISAIDELGICIQLPTEALPKASLSLMSLIKLIRSINYNYSLPNFKV